MFEYIRVRYWTVQRKTFINLNASEIEMRRWAACLQRIRNQYFRTFNISPTVRKRVNSRFSWHWHVMRQKDIGTVKTALAVQTQTEKGQTTDHVLDIPY